MKRFLSCILLLLTVTLMQAQQIVYVVKSGDTLKKIARMYNISKKDIISNNPQAASGIYAGMELYLPTTQSGKGKKHADQRRQESDDYQSEYPNDYLPENSYDYQTEYPNENPNRKVNSSVVYNSAYQEEGSPSHQVTSHEVPSNQGSSHEGIYFDTEDNGGIEFGVITDNKLKFDIVQLSASFVFDNGLSIRALGDMTKYENDNIKDRQNWILGLGYNARIRFNENLFLDLRPTIYYNHFSQKVANGTELKKNPYYKGKDLYFNTPVWEDQSKNTYGLMLEPRIAIEFSPIYLCIGYCWTFNEFKTDKENRGEGISLSIGWRP